MSAIGQILRLAADFDDLVETPGATPSPELVQAVKQLLLAEGPMIKEKIGELIDAMLSCDDGAIITGLQMAANKCRQSWFFR
jgi:hypothetical protein